MNLAIRIIAGVTLLAAIAVGAVIINQGTTSADDVTGEYSLFAESTAGAGVPLGNTFTVDVGIEPGTGTGNYQAVQWNLDYDQAIVSTDVSVITKDAAAPANCGSESDNEDRVLLGCIDIFGANLSYSGVAWHVEFTCNNNGDTSIVLQDLALPGVNVNGSTFVKIGTAPQPAHIHNPSPNITCGTGVAVPTDTPTQTATAVPPTVTNTPGPTNTAGPTNTPAPPTATFTPLNVVPPHTLTPTATPTEEGAEATGTVPPGEEPTQPPPAGATPTAPGGGAGPGGILPPDTGSGPSGGQAVLMWFGVAVTVALSGAGAGLVGWRRWKRAA